MGTRTKINKQIKRICMSFYNMINGYNPSTVQILSLLGKTTADFGRYRDVYIEDNYIVVHTRCGGGNRDDYEGVFENAAEHPWYSHDTDCDFDSTYADIYFKIPDDHTRSFAVLLDAGIDPKKKWDALLKAINS